MNGATAAPTLTEEQAAKAFALWEKRYRSEPNRFLSANEVARMEVADVATASAIYFMALLREETAARNEQLLRGWE